MRLASRFGHVNQIRRDRPLTHEELMHYVPSIFGEDRHTSRSERYAYIPTITVLESLQREGFQPFFACQTRVRDPGRRGYTKHMLRLRRDGEINGQHVPEIILLNSHDGTSSYQMLPGYFRFVCQNGCVCGQSLGEVRVPHRGNVVEKVIEGAYEVVGVFDRITPSFYHHPTPFAVNGGFANQTKTVSKIKAIAAIRKISFAEIESDCWVISLLISLRTPESEP